MSLDAVRQVCRGFAGVTEDVKWGNDLVFSVGGKMFAVVCLEPPHTLAFKCTPEVFAELTERDGMVPAPYLARAMWVQEQEIGYALARVEFEQLIRTSYALVVAKLPKPRQPAGPRAAAAFKTKLRMRAAAPSSAARSRPGHATSRRRRG